MILRQLINNELMDMLPRLNTALNNLEQYDVHNSKRDNTGVELWYILSLLRDYLEHDNTVMCRCMISALPTLLDLAIPISPNTVDVWDRYYHNRGKDSMLEYSVFHIYKNLYKYENKHLPGILYVYLTIAMLFKDRHSTLYYPNTQSQLYTYMNVITLNTHTLSHHHIDAVINTLQEDTNELIWNNPNAIALGNYVHMAWLFFLMEASHIGCNVNDNVLSKLLLDLSKIGCTHLYKPIMKMKY